MEKYFLLDRDYALKSIARCIMVSENSFIQEDINNAKKEYNVESTVIYKGVDIPHYIEFDYENNTIKEKNIETSIDIPDVEPENNDIFNEDVAVEPGVYYFYIDKNIADTEFTAVNMATFKKPLLKPNEYFQKDVYEIKGTEYPNYITFEDGKIREATEYEKYTRGQRELQDREVVFKNEIIYLEAGWHIQDDELIKVERPDDMVNPVFNEKAHIWEETATESEIYISKLRKEYREYKEMDSPSILREMELTDTSIVDEYILMMIELRELISNYNMGISTISDIPTPSKALVDFKNRIKNIL